MKIALTVALSRLVTLTCPHCGAKKLVEKKPAAFRVCKRCKKQFPDPLSRPKRR